MAGISSQALNFGNPSNRYLYNGKEKQSQEFTDGSGLEEYYYGKRMQDPQLGRWWVLDPKADLLEMSSPYVYCYNNPITYTDPDVELGIFINGRAAGGTRPENYEQNKTHPYWTQTILDAVSHSGIPYGSNQIFVDGDRYYDDGLHEGTYLNGNSASERNKAGSIIGKQDFQVITRSKFAIIGISEALSQEVNSFNIKVNVVAPGQFRTNFMDKASMQYAKNRIPVYGLDEAEKHWSAYSGKQIGDPENLVRILTEIANLKSPPFRLLLEPDTYQLIKEHREKEGEEFEKWKHLTLSNNFD